MKRIQFLIISTLLFFSCNGRASDANISNVTPSKIKAKTCCVPDTNLFYYKHLKCSPDLNDLDIVSKMHGLNNAQVKEWLQPLFHNPISSSKSESYIKMISFQNRTPEYTSIIIATTLEMAEQYFINISKEGKFVSGILISYLRNLSNSEVDYDSTQNTYRFMSKTISCFDKDTVKVFTLEMLSKKKEAQNDQDYFEELYETDYKIDYNGSIRLVHQRKKLKRDFIDIHF